MGRFLGIIVKELNPALRKPTKCPWLREPEGRSNFLSLPAHLFVFSYITEISLHVTISNQSHSLTMAWEADRRSNFFSPPANLCAVTCKTEISLILTFSNRYSYSLSYYVTALWCACGLKKLDLQSGSHVMVIWNMAWIIMLICFQSHV